MYKRLGSPININVDLVVGHGHGAITVPAASLQDPATRAQYDIVDVIDQPRPDDRYNWVTDNGDGTWTARQKDIDVIRQIKLAELAAERYRIEVAGITLPDGTAIATDRSSQALLTGALLKVMRNPAARIDWKNAAGLAGAAWDKIGKAEVEAIADAVSDHVQACFSAERIKAEAIQAITDAAELIAYDTRLVNQP